MRVLVMYCEFPDEIKYCVINSEDQSYIDRILELHDRFLGTDDFTGEEADFLSNIGNNADRVGKVIEGPFDCVVVTGVFL